MAFPPLVAFMPHRPPMLFLDALIEHGESVVVCEKTFRDGDELVSEGQVSALVTIELVGTDRPGILRSISGVFAAHRVNVEELASERVNAPIDGGMLFQAKATVFVPTEVKLGDVRADLEKIAADLMVDLKVQPANR